MHTSPTSQPSDSQEHPRFDGEGRLYENMRDEITERLRPVCAHMKTEDFERLVTDVCELKFRWIARERHD